MTNIVKPDTHAAIDFLQRFRPEGPWVLTSIQTDKKGMTTRTFTSDSLDAMREWIEGFNGKRNIYFHVNPPTRLLTKKAERTDIKSMDWLHVDIDPRVGEELEDERERALGLLTTKLPKGVPQPTCVVFSGGGYQGFWKLAEPFHIGGDLGRAEDAKRWNQQLELLFGADNCHNVDRIMRVPGTVNLPDAKKAKKGRAPTLARVVEFNDNVYPLDQFVPAKGVQTTGGFEAQTVEISGNIERIMDLDELDQWDVPIRTRVIIAQGNHPDETKVGDSSRSAWVFDAVCALIRCEVPDDVIFSLLTDPDFGISESVLEKGANASKYAIRQIERAKEEVIHPALRELNEKWAVANDGGKVRVIKEAELNGRRVLERMSFDDFRNLHMNRQVQMGTNQQGLPVMKPLGKFWLEHPKRKQYSAIVFEPGKAEVNGVYNMWKGFTVPARPGDWSLLREHIYENIAQGDEASYEYILSWMARAVQLPAEPAGAALILQGDEGTGKGVFAKAMLRLFGQHGLHIAQPSHLTGRFNDHLRDCVLLFADEQVAQGGEAEVGALKALITEDTRVGEAKGRDATSVPNFLHIIMASNEDWVVEASAGSRRYAVFEVSSARKDDYVYFAAVGRQLDEGGLSGMLHDLLTRDISHFHPGSFPKTKALLDQRAMSEKRWYTVIKEMAERGSTLDHDGWKMDPAHVSVRAVIEAAGHKLTENSVVQAVQKTLVRLSDGCEPYRARRKCIKHGGEEILVRGSHFKHDVRSVDRRLYKLRVETHSVHQRMTAAISTAARKFRASLS